MTMNNKKTFAILSSFAGILIIMAILVIANAILKPVNFRLDCTDGKLYTLSKGTKNILKDLDKVVSIRFYYSRDAADMPVYLKTYAGRVEDMLQEFKRDGGNRIDLRKLNPKPDSDEEDSAMLDGVSGQSLDALGAGDRIYLGIAISCAGKTAALPFLSPESESQLEYNLARAITEVTQVKKPRLGIMSPLRVMGGFDQQQMMMGQQPRQIPAWLIINEFKRNFDVEEIPLTAEEIDSNIDMLVVIHPSGISDNTMFALDQFVLRGGNLLAFVDPFCVVAMQQQQPQQYMGMPQPSSLEKLLSAWGISFTADKIMADRKLGTRIRGNQGGVESMPTVISLGKNDINTDDPAVATLNSLLVFCGGSFSGEPVDGLKKTVLVHTSDEAGPIDTFMAQQPGQEILRSLSAGIQKKYALAIKLTGTFPTAFPDGKPKGTEGKEEKTEKAVDSSLKKSTKPGAVVLVGDADMLFDSFAVREGNLFGQKVVQPINDNLNFAMNIVDQLTGDSNLFEIRARATASHPFTVVRDMQAEAEKEFQDKIIKLETDLREVQMKINELQSKRGQDEKELLSSEQREVLKQFRRKEAEAKKELKEVRRQLRSNIDLLENKLIFINVALMPIIVILIGIAVAIVKLKRSKRR